MGLRAMEVYMINWIVKGIFDKEYVNAVEENGEVR